MEGDCADVVISFLLTRRGVWPINSNVPPIKLRYWPINDDVPPIKVQFWPINDDVPWIKEHFH